MQRSAEDQSLDAVLDDMGNAARKFKAAKYTPKPAATAPEAAEAPADAPQLGAAELESLLNGG